MKKSFITLMCLAVFAISLSAQKLPKSVKDAKKALNANNYTEALSIIDEALKDDAVSSISEAWAVKGSIYNKMLSAERDDLIKAVTLQQEYIVKNTDVALPAFNAFENAIAKAVDDKDKGKKASIKGLVDLATHLNDIGRQLFQEQKFDKAFEAFNTILNARTALNGLGNKSILSNDTDFQDIQYFTGLAAAYAKTPEKASSIYKALVDADYPATMPYEQVFASLIETDSKAAFEVLEKGKKNCAEIEGAMKNFLYKEINYYLKKGQYDQLETKLQDAIAQDSENPSLYYALGGVYSSFVKDAKSSEDATRYATEAEKYYNLTIEKDPTFADAAFDIGVIYHTKGVSLNDELKTLNSDISNAGMKKYDAKQAEQKEFFMKSVPHFERAIDIDPKHSRAMDALKGIAAYIGDDAMLAKYEGMLKALGE